MVYSMPFDHCSNALDEVALFPRRSMKDVHRDARSSDSLKAMHHAIVWTTDAADDFVDYIKSLPFRHACYRSNSRLPQT
jgi:hypothetical protein